MSRISILVAEVGDEEGISSISSFLLFTPMLPSFSLRNLSLFKEDWTKCSLLIEKPREKRVKQQVEDKNRRN